MSNDHESHRRQKSLETQKLVKLLNGSVIDQPTFCHSNSYDEQPSQSCQSSVLRGKWKSIAKRLYGPRVWVLARNQVFFFRLRSQARPRPGQSFKKRKKHNSLIKFAPILFLNWCRTAPPTKFFYSTSQQEPSRFLIRRSEAIIYIQWIELKQELYFVLFSSNK